MGKQHFHAELIKAWADGATIQFFRNEDEAWLDLKNPSWEEDVEYRIKPRLFKDGSFYFANYHGDHEIVQFLSKRDGFFVCGIDRKHDESSFDFIGEEVKFPEDFLE